MGSFMDFTFMPDIFSSYGLLERLSYKKSKEFEWPFRLFTRRLCFMMDFISFRNLEIELNSMYFLLFSISMFSTTLFDRLRRTSFRILDSFSMKILTFSTSQRQSSTSLSIWAPHIGIDPSMVGFSSQMGTVPSQHSRVQND